jgi:hypothetical protein
MASSRQPDALVGRWIHSWEEDSGENRTYRREGFDFPLSRRPRQVVDLMADGHFVSRSGGPADATVAREGRWEARNSVLLTLQQDPDAEAILEIMDLQERLLTVRQLRGTIE